MPALCAESARSASHRVGMKRRAAQPAFTGRNPRHRHRAATHAVEARAVTHAFVTRPDQYVRMKKLNLATFVEGKVVYQKRGLAF